MKYTDNRKRRHRHLTKLKRHKRVLIRFMRRILILLCIVLFIICGYKFTNNKNKLIVLETESYDTAYYQMDFFASDLCIVNQTENIKLADMSKLKAYGLFDINCASTFYAYKIFDKVYPASTTKILTALVALENADLSDSVIVSKNACSTSFAIDEQTCGIKEGDLLTLEDLLYGLLLYSGNDTAVAIAEHVGGSVENFAEMMNLRAKELMATHSNFVNPSGLYDDNHYTTAYDLYLIFNECLKQEKFVNIIKADSYSTEITNTFSNEVRTLKWEPTNFYALGEAESPKHVTVIGGKTGTLLVAGNCLVLMSEDKTQNPYISIVMGADTKELLYQDMTSLLAEIPKNK